MRAAKLVVGMFVALAATACTGQVTVGSYSGACSPLGATACENGQLRRCVADDRRVSVWSEPTVCADGFCSSTESCGVAPLVAAPVITSPGPCESVATIDTAVLEFTVADLTGIDHYRIDVQEVEGCGELPSGSSINGYPTTTTVETPKTYTLQLLPPGQWHMVTVESSASLGFKSNSTTGWLKTAERPPSGSPSLSGGDYHTCALFSGGAVKCWGDDDYGQLGDGGTNADQATPTEVEGLSSGIVQIAAGGSHTCALSDVGAVKCWGRNNAGQLGDGDPTIDKGAPVDVAGLSSGVSAISAGGSHTCALLEGGAVKCWGDEEWGQLGNNVAGADQHAPIPVDVIGLSSGVVAVSAGTYHTCALLEDGAVKCWGRDNAGQLGDGGANSNQPTPVDVVGLTSGIVAIAAGGQHTCALPNTGAIKCWGYDGSGQLGDNGISIAQTSPVDVIGLSSGIFVVTAGGSHTCALIETGAVKCWGWDGSGQLGDGPGNADQLEPVNVMGMSSGVVAIDAGGLHTCARLDTGAIKCWGYDLNGQLGAGGTTSYKGASVGVLGLSSGAQAIAAGDYHTCALLDTGGVKCFGNDHAGQLGRGGTDEDQSAPVDVVGLSGGVSAIAAGGWHTCALLDTGGLKCWGDDGHGQLGDIGTDAEQRSPVDVVGLTAGVHAITTGQFHTCALLNTGGLKCWGDDAYGQLGYGGANANQHTPVDVAGLLTGVTAVAAGAQHTCALLSTGGVECWGDNSWGQLGDGTTSEQDTPTAVSALSIGVIAISAGGFHTCALLDDGTMRCWGYDDGGQLGDGGTNTEQATPVPVSGLSSGALSIDLGMHHSCAVLDGGALQCWGADNLGQLGHGGTNADQGVPANVAGLSSGVTAVAAGAFHTCALVDTGALECWGEDYSGQLGDGCFGNSRCVPVDVTGVL